MLQLLSKLTTNQRLALAGLRPRRLGHRRDADPAGARDCPPARARRSWCSARRDRVHVQALADDLDEGAGEFRVIDLRGEAAFTAYHLPGAENMPIASLAVRGPAGQRAPPAVRGRGVRAAQAWFLLEGEGVPRRVRAPWRPAGDGRTRSCTRVSPDPPRATSGATMKDGLRWRPSSAARPAWRRLEPGWRGRRPQPAVAAAPRPAAPVIQMPAAGAKPKAAAKKREGC